ncbi:hypothetical protein Emag_001420 [Eimeria magna]
MDFFGFTPGTSKVAIPPEEVNASYCNYTKETAAAAAAAAATAAAAAEEEEEAAAAPSSGPVAAAARAAAGAAATAALAAGAGPAGVVAAERGLDEFQLGYDLEKKETVDGEKKDVYGLGCLLSQILTGQHPFIRPDKFADWR